MTDFRSYLKHYDGPELRLMEVCGTHTAQISKCGIPDMLSPKIRLVSGPGCPVCVTVSAYIDKLVELSLNPKNVVVTFGDMMRVCGSKQSLYDAKALGGNVQIAYSPMDMLRLAAADPQRNYIFAAVGFETTAPLYALLLQEAEKTGMQNVKILSSLKTMPQVIDWVCANQGGVDGFIAPGHVSVITGSEIFRPLAEKFGLPFAVSGFEGEQILAAVYTLTQMKGQGRVVNLYPSAVKAEGNREAQELVARYFEPCDSAWRGMGTVAGSGIILREQYARFDAGSAGLIEDRGGNPLCRCAKVLTGALSPTDCPLFGKVCTPKTPQGACMVSLEGSCYHYFINKRSR